MDKYMIDVPVLLIFWKRYEIFKQTFEAVKKSKPSVLLFYQDGPKGEEDIDELLKCRGLIDSIDWQCKIYSHFNDENVGCDPNVYNAIKWAFERVDKCIILEDDVVASFDFFRFSKEMLDKYEFDNRINMICGMNTQMQINRETSYIFSRFGSIWGWATWKRVIDQWDPTYGILNTYYVNNLLYYYPSKLELNYALGKVKKHAKSKTAYHESINLLSQISNYQLNIVPTVNLVKNIGLSNDSTHSTNDLKLLIKKQRILYNMDIYSMKFPLKHPKYITQDISFDKHFKYNAFNKVMDTIKYQLLKVKYGRFDLILRVLFKNDKSN